MSSVLNASSIPISNLARKEAIDLLEDEMKKEDQLPEEMTPVRHYFSNGMYARELFLKAGSMITGKIKKEPYLSILSYGAVLVATNEGSQEVMAPYVEESKDGTKRVLYALTDCVWTTIHKTDETDIEKVEQAIIEGVES